MIEASEPSGTRQTASTRIRTSQAGTAAPPDPPPNDGTRQTASTRNQTSQVGTAAPPGASPPARENGQAAVEFAIVLPIVLIVILGIAQVGIAIRNELAVQLAAREGARAAAVSADPTGAATLAATRAVDLPIEVSTTLGSDVVTVTVTHLDHTGVPVVGLALGPIEHRASVTMAIEPP